MSEPVKHSEIEDVLSSIRRLVSDTHRHPLKPGGQLAKAHLDRLVLTDALRVPEPDDAEADMSDDAASAEPDADLEVENAPVPSATVDHFVFAPRARGKAENDRQSGDDAPDDDADIARDPLFGAEPAPEIIAPKTDDAAPVETAVELATEDAVADTHSDDETAGGTGDAEERPMFEGVASTFTDDDDAPWSDPETTLYEAAGMAMGAEEEPYGNPDDIRPLTEKIAALEEVIGQTDDQWDPDDPGVDDYAGTEVETLEWDEPDTADDDAGVEMPMFRHTVLEEDAETVDDAAALGEESAPAPQDARAPVEDIAAEPVEDIAEPVENIAEPVDVAEEPVDVAEEPVGDIAELADDSAAAVEESAEPADDSAADAVAYPEPFDETTMDEAALRQLVAEIVREELQGVLGERITRNVRKLVRREIHRALTLQELD